MNKVKYYIMNSIHGAIEAMDFDMIRDLPKQGDDNWMFGEAFIQPPEEPVIFDIAEGEEDLITLPYNAHPPIASNEFIEALLEAGIDNLELYDAILENYEADKQITGYKAFNIVGLVKMAGPETKFLSESREGDASIEKLHADVGAVKGSYMFRLAESWDTIVVHEKVKRHLETKNFIGLKFTELDGAFIL